MERRRGNHCVNRALDRMGVCECGGFLIAFWRYFTPYYAGFPRGDDELEPRLFAPL